MSTSIERMKAMVTIVNRGEGMALSRLYTKNKILLHVQISAEGTASSELLARLGLPHSERDVLISFGSESAVAIMMNKLDDDLRGILRVRGIAMSLPLSGVSSIIADAYSIFRRPEGGTAMSNEKNLKDKEHCLILVTLNQGYTDEVMRTACRAGATGATAIRGRWVGAETLEQFYDIKLQDEKEILAIGCTRDSRNAIMDAIVSEHGLQSQVQAVVCSLPVDRMVRLS